MFKDKQTNQWTFPFAAYDWLVATVMAAGLEYKSNPG